MTHALARRALALASAVAVLTGCSALAASTRTAPNHTASGVPADGALLGKPASATWQVVAPSGLSGMAPARILVQQADALDPRPAMLVERLGGRVTRHLPIIDGFAASVPAGAVETLARSTWVTGVLPDQRVLVAGTVGEALPPKPQPTPRPAPGPRRVPRPLPRPLPKPAPTAPAALTSIYRDVVGATRLNAGGNTGAGATVAMVDTGVAEAEDLAGRMVEVRDGLGGLLGGSAKCKNLSGEGGCGDGYGHGTFIAGLIAGNGRASAGRHRGVAPGARLLSVKIAGRDGSSDASTLLAAIQWVVSHRRTYGIDVLNLSLGTDASQSYLVDPLNIAVERAWRAGIVVVTAASNRGPDPRTISKPGDDPYVITVGAVDDRGTASISDDTVPDFSARGPTAADGLAKPDLVAPGAGITSLNARGSLINRHFPVAGPYRRGSGTSMATAMVSGLAALARAAHPRATPDRVKFMLTATARPVAGTNRLAVGAGVVDGWRALNAAPRGLANQNLRTLARRAGAARQAGHSASLDGSRGRVRTRTVGPVGSFGTVLSDVQTTTLAAWDPGSVLSPWTEHTWRQTTWQLRSILPTRWSGTDWSGRNWQWHTGHAARRPGAARTYGRSLPGSTWYGVWR
jgi:serine protease AprX